MSVLEADERKILLGKRTDTGFLLYELEPKQTTYPGSHVTPSEHVQPRPINAGDKEYGRMVRVISSDK